MNYSIAIDGPAGAGKSTIARKVAADLGFIYVDTGAMYRAIALYLIRNGIPAENEEVVSKVCGDVNVTIAYENGEQQVWLNGQNVSGLIRSEEVGAMASESAKNKAVRQKLVDLQRELARTGSVVMDGRDIGTCVLPQASVKIYLTADAKERAVRRWKELTGKGIACDKESIEADIISRDEQDMNREISPLVKAEDALYLDTTDMNIEEVVRTILEIARTCMGES